MREGVYQGDEGTKDRGEDQAEQNDGARLPSRGASNAGQGAVEHAAGRVVTGGAPRHRNVVVQMQVQFVARHDGGAAWVRVKRNPKQMPRRNRAPGE